MVWFSARLLATEEAVQSCGWREDDAGCRQLPQRALRCGCDRR